MLIVVKPVQVPEKFTGRFRLYGVFPLKFLTIGYKPFKKLSERDSGIWQKQMPWHGMPLFLGSTYRLPLKNVLCSKIQCCPWYLVANPFLPPVLFQVSCYKQTPRFTVFGHTQKQVVLRYSPSNKPVPCSHVF